MRKWAGHRHKGVGSDQPRGGLSTRQSYSGLL